MAEAAPLRQEIRQLLTTHAGEPVDYVALFILLNTVAGGHYEERYPEEALRDALREELAAGGIRAYAAADAAEIPPGEVEPGTTACVFRLA